jgi:hypothetical protein
MSCSGLDLSLIHHQQGIAWLVPIRLLADRVMAEIFIKPMHLVQLDSADKQAISRGNRGFETVAPRSVRRERQRAKKISYMQRDGAL